MEKAHSRPTRRNFRIGMSALVMLAGSFLLQARTSVEADPVNPTILKQTLARMHGTAKNDMVTGISTDPQRNIHVAGNTMEAESSGFVRKYSASGTLLWAKNKPLVSVGGIALDKAGNSYLSGSFSTGMMQSLRYVIYLEKYDAAGNLLWMKSFRAAASSDPIRMTVNGVAVDPTGNGSVIILFERSPWPYQSTQVFIRKYNLSGVAIWEKPVGSSSPYTARPVFTVTPSGNICTAVNTHSLNRDWNTTISYFGKLGNHLNSTQLHPTGSSFETKVHAITSDQAGNVSVAGITKGHLDGWNQGFQDGFVRKYDNSGKTVWTRQFGTTANDYANGLISDTAGDLYVVGSTSGSLASANRGSFDAVIRKYASSGDLLHSSQFGGSFFDVAMTATIDAGGQLHVAGHTTGNLGGINQGLQDLYFTRFSVSP